LRANSSSRRQVPLRVVGGRLAFLGLERLDRESGEDPPQRFALRVSQRDQRRGVLPVGLFDDQLERPPVGGLGEPFGVGHGKP